MGALRASDVKRGKSLSGGLVSGAVVAHKIWEDAWPARDFYQPKRWLSSLGLDVDGVPGALDRLRYHPHCPLAAWRERARGGADMVRSCPALLAPLESLGPPSPMGGRLRAQLGVMAWYLTPDGSQLAQLRGRDGRLRPAIKTWGQQKRAGIWLTDVDGPGPLVVAVGMVAAWTYGQTLLGCGQPVRLLAAPSLHGLQGGVVRLGDGALPLWKPEADHSNPPVLLSRPGDVQLLLPADMDAVQLKVREAPEEETQVMMMSPIDRADLAGAVASAHWRAAGAQSVRIVKTMGALGVDEL